MNIDSASIPLQAPEAGEERSNEIRQKKAAIQFEEIFARQLVREMTKGSFEMSGTGVPGGSSSHLYREFITDALAGELAEQRALGMADLVGQYWNRLDTDK